MTLGRRCNVPKRCKIGINHWQNLTYFAYFKAAHSPTSAARPTSTSYKVNPNALRSVHIHIAQNTKNNRANLDTEICVLGGKPNVTCGDQIDAGTDAPIVHDYDDGFVGLLNRCK